MTGGAATRTLILVPTYDERDNVGEMIARLDALALAADLLFVDDASPDGTGELLAALAAERADLHVIHRPGKLGIGGAHRDGIAWAYEHGYERLVTLDCDFSHSPEDIPRLLAEAPRWDVVVGSRYLRPGSLVDWNLLRRTLTRLGHLLTVRLLRMPYDATGAFRVYDLTRIPRRLFERVESRGYSFFFECLFLVARNGLRIGEVPIVLPARTYGSSKMSVKEAVKSGLRVWELWLRTLVRPEQFSVAGPFTEIDPELVDPQQWDDYWSPAKQRRSNRIYDVIAALYRNLVIRRQLNRFVRRHFSPGSQLLHAGCGSGQVDADCQREMAISAVDISPAALDLYRKNHPRAQGIRHASILRLPFADGSFDGAYNLGVMEHFTGGEIRRILAELHRVLRPEGKVILLWPHARASSVLVLRLAHWILNRGLRKDVRFHPPEVSLLRSKRAAAALVREACFELIGYEFGPRDLFVQAVVVARKAQPLAGRRQRPVDRVA